LPAEQLSDGGRDGSDRASLRLLTSDVPIHRDRHRHQHFCSCHHLGRREGTTVSTLLASPSMPTRNGTGATHVHPDASDSPVGPLRNQVDFARRALAEVATSKGPRPKPPGS
jgi:hypothetical protein